VCTVGVKVIIIHLVLCCVQSKVPKHRGPYTVDEVTSFQDTLAARFSVYDRKQFLSRCENPQAISQEKAVQKL